MSVKQGDLCFIKNSVRVENIGLIVTAKECIGKLKKGDIFDFQMHTSMAPISDIYWVIYHPSGSLVTTYGKTTESYIAQSWLVPIRPEPEDEFDSNDVTNDNEVMA